MNFQRLIVEIGIPAIAAISQALTAFLGYRATVRTLTEEQKRRYEIGFFILAVLGVAAISVGAWRATSEKYGIESSYVYFMPSSDPRDAHNSGIRLVSISTGVLYNVRLAVQLTADHDAGVWNYFIAGDLGLIDEGTNRTGLVLSFGDHTIDIDPPSRRGKVRQRLDIVLNNDRPVVVSTLVRRKENGEILCALPRREGVRAC